jgi:hypothetical protein
LDLKKNINLFPIKSFVPHHEGWHLNGYFHKFSKQKFSKLSNNISNTLIEVIWLSSHHLNDWERFWQCRSLFKDVVLTWINKFILNFFIVFKFYFLTSNILIIFISNLSKWYTAMIC